MKGANKKEESRQEWSSRTEFCFATIGFVVGIGNVWRFPYLAYRYGGGAFLIPYFVALFVVALPLIVMELALGQMSQKNPGDSFRLINKRLSGLGIGSVVLSYLACLYYCVLLAWSLLFLLHSFSADLPWTSDPESFFFEKVLERTDSISSLGSINWRIYGCLVAVWIFVYFSVFKGVRWSGKIAIFTVTLPYILLVILFIRGITLENAGKGILYYITPDFSMLLIPEIWSQATAQVFFSLSPGFGILLSYGSFLPKTEPTVRDSFFIAGVNSFTSIFGGFVIFSILGFMAGERGLNIDEVTTHGPGLAFIVYPEALSLLPGISKQIFSVVFFVTLLCLGIDSVFAWVEVINQSVGDSTPFGRVLSLIRKKGRWKREGAALVVCLSMCLFGVLFSLESGIWWMTLFDHFVPMFVVLIIGIGELFSVAWVYGAAEFIEDFHLHTNQKLWPIWYYMWKFVCPLLLFVMLITSIIGEIIAPPEEFKGDSWALIVGWILAFFPGLIIIYYAIFPSLKEHVKSEEFHNLEEEEENNESEH